MIVGQILQLHRVGWPIGEPDLVIVRTASNFDFHFNFPL